VRLILYAVVGSVLIAGPAFAQCFKPDADGQVAEGRLAIVQARDAAGRVERPYILRLTNRACMDADDMGDAVANVGTIHVYAASDNLQAAMRRLVGVTVSVRGRPFHRHTSHHHAPIMMEISEISAR
jgi:hypothetical protein